MTLLVYLAQAGVGFEVLIVYSQSQTPPSPEDILVKKCPRCVYTQRRFDFLRNQDIELRECQE